MLAYKKYYRSRTLNDWIEVCLFVVLDTKHKKRLKCDIKLSDSLYNPTLLKSTCEYLYYCPAFMTYLCRTIYRLIVVVAFAFVGTVRNSHLQKPSESITKVPWTCRYLWQNPKTNYIGNVSIVAKEKQRQILLRNNRNSNS